MKTKITIKQLQKDIKALRGYCVDWQSKYLELKKDIDNKESFNIGVENARIAECKNQIKNLFEIIRWQTNPETTKIPFISDLNGKNINRFN